MGHSKLLAAALDHLESFIINLSLQLIEMLLKYFLKLVVRILIVSCLVRIFYEFIQTNYIIYEKHKNNVIQDSMIFATKQKHLSKEERHLLTLDR